MPNRADDSSLASHTRMMAEVRQADRQVKSGHYIKNDDMMAWLLSWGTEHELPVPKCVCGKEHGDEALCARTDSQPRAPRRSPEGVAPM